MYIYTCSKMSFFKKGQFYNCIGCETKLNLFKVALSQSTANVLFMVSSRRENSVRVRKGGLMVDLLLR